jgi:hypothetical protein
MESSALAVSFCLGLVIQLFWIKELVDWMSAGTENYGMAPMLMFMMNVLCLIVLASLIISTNMTCGNTFGLLLMMLLSWVVLILGFSFFIIFLAAVGLGIGLIIAPSYGFAYFMEWLITPNNLASLGFDKTKLALVFYPLCFAFGGAAYIAKNGVFVCFRLGQLQARN